VRVAALYDVHGNLPALDAVLAEVERNQVDLIVVGGDVVAGPLPRETLERVLDLGPRARLLRGNADREVVARAGDPPESDEELWAARARWAAGRLTPAQLDLLAGLPLSFAVEVDGLGPTRFCHATPRSDEEIVTSATPDARLLEALREADERVVVVRFVNAGSVGMPYEGEPGACWTLLGPDVEPRRTAYDVGAALDRFRAVGFPDAEEHGRTLLDPPGPEDATAQFERLAGR
jgi:hypothetical protein